MDKEKPKGSTEIELQLTRKGEGGYRDGGEGCGGKWQRLEREEVKWAGGSRVASEVILLAPKRITECLTFTL